MSPVALHPAARSAWWDLGHLSLKQYTEEGMLRVIGVVSDFEVLVQR